MLSPTNTDPSLTRDALPGGRGAYARLIAPDDRQGAAMAAELRRRGVRSVFVLDDGGPGLDPSGHFTVAARARGLRIAGRLSWTGRTRAAIARRVARSGAGAVYLAGLLDRGAGEMVRALRRELPAGTTIAAHESLLPVAGLFAHAGPAARGVLIATGGVPSRTHPYVRLAARAARTALEVIARSDGTRRSVAGALRADDRFDARGDARGAAVAILAARRPGGSRQLMSTDGAELLAVR